MTQRMQELLAQRAAESFVGRSEETTALLCMLERDRPPPTCTASAGSANRAFWRLSQSAPAR